MRKQAARPAPKAQMWETWESYSVFAASSGFSAGTGPIVCSEGHCRRAARQLHPALIAAFAANLF
jgi:hypothetical protein